MRGEATLARPTRFFDLALVLYVLIVVVRLHEAVPFLPAFYLGKISALLLFVAILQQRDRSAFRALLRNHTARSIAAISVLAVLSVPGSFWPRESVSFFENQWLQGLLLFVAVMVGFADRRTGDLLLGWLTIAATVAAAQLLVGAGLVVNGRAYIGGAGSATYDPNETAALFVMALPYAVLVAGRAGKLRWLGRAAIPTLLMAIVKTGSRGAVVALAVLLAVVFITGDGRRRRLCLVLAGLAVGLFALTPHDDLVQRFGDLLGGGGDYNFDSRDGRLEIWKRGFGLMFDHPVFGVGIGTYEIANGVTAGSWLNAHNAYIQIGVELGVGGMVAFAAATVYAVAGAWRETRRGVAQRGSVADRQVAHAVLASLLGVLVAAMFLSMAYAAITMFALAAAAGVVLRGERNRAVARLTSSAVEPPDSSAGWRTGRSATPRWGSGHA